MPPSNLIRWGGLAALMAGVVGLLYFPFHASAYFATEAGAPTLESPWVAAWAEPFADAFAALLTFAPPDTVYTTYGKVYLLVILGFLAGVLALHAQQASRAGQLEKWGFRIALVATVVGTIGAFGEYYTPYLDFSFLAFSVPGILLLMISSPLYGLGTLRARMAPRLGAGLLTIGGFPGIILMTLLSGHLSGGLVLLDLAWIALGYALWTQRGLSTERHPRVR